jgi:hypothetical protein
MPGTVSEVWVQPPSNDYSYIVGKYNSTFYYAKNGTTGNYDYFATNVNVVVENAEFDGASFLITGGVLYASSSLFLLYDNLAFTFLDCNWTVASGVANSGIICFHGDTKNNLYFNFINSWLDCNIANQSPNFTENDMIIGIGLLKCSNINIPHFEGTGFGGNKCYGFGVDLVNCTDITIGSIRGSNCGSDVLSLHSCRNVQVESAYGYNLSQVDPYACVVTIFTFENESISENIQIGKVMGEETQCVFRIGGDYGITRYITVGEIIGNNVLDGVSIDTASWFGGNWSTLHDVSIGSIIVNNITRQGMKISAARPNGIYNIHIGDAQFYLQNPPVRSGWPYFNWTAWSGGSYALDIYNSKDVKIDSLLVENASINAINIINSTYVQMGTIIGKNTNQSLLNIYNVKNVQIDSVMGINIGCPINRTLYWYGIVTIGNFYDNFVTENVQVGKINGYNVSYLCTIGATNGTTKQVYIGSIIGQNVIDGLITTNVYGECYDVTVDSLLVYDCWRYGARVSSHLRGLIHDVEYRSVYAIGATGATDIGGWGLGLWNAYRARIDSCYVENFYKDGVYVDNSTDCQLTIRVKNCNVADSAYCAGITVSADSVRNIIHAESIIDISGGGPRHRYGVQETATADYNVYYIDKVVGYTIASYVLNGAHSIVPTKFIESVGSAANTTSTTFTFNHGLGATPSFVSANFNTLAITGYTWSAGATTITITVTGTGLPGSMTCYWHATALNPNIS